MVEEQRLMEEERQKMRKEHEKRVKEEQKKILGKNNSRPKLSFSLKPVTWVYLFGVVFMWYITVSINRAFSGMTLWASKAHFVTLKNWVKRLEIDHYLFYFLLKV